MASTPPTRGLRPHGLDSPMPLSRSSWYSAGSSGTSRPFDIRQGVRQGCVLSPRLFACVLQWALRSWRARVEHCGLDFEDGMAPLLDLRFADDLLLFFSPHAFCRDRSQVKELFYWSASRHWDCFYTGQSPDVQSPRQSLLTNQGGCGGSRLGCVGSGGSCARRSLRDGGSPSRL